jgi:hypothetical protein
VDDERGKWFHAATFGAFIHFGLYSELGGYFHGKGPYESGGTDHGVGRPPHGDVVEFVGIFSQKGGQCILQNPCPDTKATVYRNGKAAEGLSGKLLTFSTTVGERVAVIPKGKTPTTKTLR